MAVLYQQNKKATFRVPFNLTNTYMIKGRYFKGMYVKIQRHQPCISKYISDPTLYLFQILNIRNCVLDGDIASIKICSSIERFGGFNIDSDKTKFWNNVWYLSA